MEPSSSSRTVSGINPAVDVKPAKVPKRAPAFLEGHAIDENQNDSMENLGFLARRDGRNDVTLAWIKKAYAAAVRRGEDGARDRLLLDDLRWPLPALR